MVSKLKIAFSEENTLLLVPSIYSDNFFLNYFLGATFSYLLTL